MKNNPKQKTKRISTAACLPVELRQKVEDYADQNKTSYSQAMERMIKEFFANQPARPESEALRLWQDKILGNPFKFKRGDFVYALYYNMQVIPVIVVGQSNDKVDISDGLSSVVIEEDLVFRTRAEAEAYAQTLKGETNAND